MKASREHLSLWTGKAMLLFVILASISVSGLWYVLQSALQPARPIPSGSLSGIVAVSVVVSIALVLVRKDFAVAATNRFDFVTLYYWEWVIRIVFMCILTVFFLSIILFVFPSLRSSTTAYLFIVSFVSYLVTYPMLLYTDFFSYQGEAYLCLQQALNSVDLDDFNRWFKRGVKAAVKRLERIGLRVAGADIVFAVNVKILRGESVKDALERMASDIINLAPPKNEPSRLQPFGLYEIIETLTRLAHSARNDGLHVVPSYHEQMSRAWDFVTKSVPIVALFVTLAIALYSYFATGKLPFLPGT